MVIKDKNTREVSKNTTILPFKRFSLDTTEDPKKIFNFPFLINSETISVIKNDGRVMFIIRGPPYTKKTKLSNMLRETYPASPFCCMVKLTENYETKDDSSNLKHETLEQTRQDCTKAVLEACRSKKSTIIIQNSHMRKKEIQPWLDLAAEFDYIVIMAATMYKFDITPEALIREDGLHVSYLQKRFNEWEDVPPLFTAWFISPNDSEKLRSITFEKLRVLNKIKLIRSWFETDVANYFQPRENMCSLAGYSANADAMKKYYFSNDVQQRYGKCYPIFILGFLITKTDVIGVAKLNENGISLVMDDLIKRNGNKAMREIPKSILQYGKTTKFPFGADLPPKSSGFLYRKGEKVSAKLCRPIHVAQKGFDVFNLEKVSEQFQEGLQLMSDKDGNLNEKYFFKSRIYKLSDDLWFTNVMEKFRFSTIFTGFYV
ncbi:uncharacterized protein [Parasteatoda tepidariorum]|uniref:uncharacterized protein n=1 Tax=Parasteatoda tepidariorum TaxID=114398 RepID=UPI00077FA96D|nr:uncharacterized protein LOC107441103 [Parasteatoda tepidariorum]XP_042897388.1 uncharacterized protein LOC107441103 [Parasteatoda tepidariorum]